MSFKWKHFFYVADKLASQAPSATKATPNAATEEALLRTAIGRFYYGAFGECYSYVKTYLGHSPPHSIEKSGKKHAWVVKVFLKSQDAKMIGIAHKLKTLRKYRNQADYDIVLSESPQKLAALSRQKAVQILSALGISIR